MGNHDQGLVSKYPVIQIQMLNLTLMILLHSHVADHFSAHNVHVNQPILICFFSYILFLPGAE